MKDLINHFAIDGEVLSIENYGNGHINKTFLVKTTKNTYIFQLINAVVFHNIEMLMNNISLVTEHLRNKGINTLEIVKTKDGKLFTRYGDDYARGYAYIANSICYEALPTLDLVREAARGFGEFHKNLVDIDISNIGDTIPDFHHTKKRFDFFKSIIEKDPKGRLEMCKEDVEFLMSREKDYSLITSALEDGSIKQRITHNDPKINNVAFDKNSGKVSCILDLDTVMLGSYLYDFGDGLRSLFTGDNEDCPDTSKLVVNLDIYRAYLDGYYSMMAGALNDKEIVLLPYSILIITEELALRFLGDFVNGDVYFGVDYSTHNLVRARTQIALAKDIIKHMDELTKITSEIVEKYGK